MAEKHYQVNWVDGMKLNRGHFVALDNYINERLRETLASQIRTFNYGLLPNPDGAPLYKVSIDIDRNHLLRVKILEMHALLPSGVRIDISKGQNQLVNTDFSRQLDLKNLQSKSLFVVLSVNPFGRTPVGTPDPEEVPPRYPFVDFEYTVNVLRVEDLILPSSGYYHICIGKVEIKGNICEVLDDYIPPCASMRSHEDLIELYNQLDGVLSKMEDNCIAIIQKIYKKDQTLDLAKSVLYFAENISIFFSSNITRFRWIINEDAPIHLFDFFSSLARVVKNTLDQKAGAGKEQMLNYFKNWIVEINQGEFELVIEDIINLQYNHNDLNESLTFLQSFIVTLNLMLSKLSKLDYIGDKKGATFIVTSDEAQDIQPKKKKNFLME